MSSENTPNFFGTKLEAVTIARPLVAASRECQRDCEKLYDEWSDLFHESATHGSGALGVAFCERPCTEQQERKCGVNSVIVGHLVDGVFLPLDSPLIDNPEAQELVNNLFTLLTGVDNGEKTLDAKGLSDTRARLLDSLSVAVTRFGINGNYPIHPESD